MDFSVILGLAGILGQLLMSRRPIAGWTIALLNQPLWVLFAILTGSYGLLLMTPGYLLAAAINLRKAIQTKTVTPTAGCARCAGTATPMNTASKHSA